MRQGGSKKNVYRQCMATNKLTNRIHENNSKKVTELKKKEIHFYTE